MQNGQVEKLRSLYRDAFEGQYRGETAARLLRAQGYADGYARALLESGVIGERDLLRLVADCRAAVAGPGIRSWQPESAALATRA